MSSSKLKKDEPRFAGYGSKIHLKGFDSFGCFIYCRCGLLNAIIMRDLKPGGHDWTFVRGGEKKMIFITG
ncbi:MAG: hypothetical protein J6Z02_06505, partial [Lachnospiraceae bacterium]|nr:hypothetical protein [Lachnospiraceae bacterium]